MLGDAAGLVSTDEVEKVGQKIAHVYRPCVYSHG